MGVLDDVGPIKTIQNAVEALKDGIENSIGCGTYNLIENIVFIAETYDILI